MYTNNKLSLMAIRGIVIALMSSHIIYVLIAQFVTTKGSFALSDMVPVVPLEQKVIGILQFALYGASGVVILLANILPGLLMRRFSKAACDEVILRGYAISKILQHALIESIGIFGLMLILLSGSLIFATFMGGALLLHLLFFPRLINVDELRSTLS